MIWFSCYGVLSPRVPPPPPPSARFLGPFLIRSAQLLALLLCALPSLLAKSSSLQVSVSFLAPCGPFEAFLREGKGGEGRRGTCEASKPHVLQASWSYASSFPSAFAVVRSREDPRPWAIDALIMAMAMVGWGVGGGRDDAPCEQVTVKDDAGLIVCAKCDSSSQPPNSFFPRVFEWAIGQTPSVVSPWPRNKVIEARHCTIFVLFTLPILPVCVPPLFATRSTC